MRPVGRKLARPFRIYSDVKRLEASEKFNRLALHDISSMLFGGLEAPDRAGQSPVGVVIPTCDRPENLKRALASVAAQSRRPDKVVVVNDGQESIKDIVEEFSNRLAIALLHTEHPYSGASTARNLGLDALDTPLVSFLDDDNLMWPRWIERAVAFLDSDPKVDIIYGAQLRDVEFSSTAKNWFLVPFDFERLKRGNYVDLNQIMHRASAIRFDPALKRLIDWDYVLRLIGSSPDRIVPVDAISSVYSAAHSNRISLGYWPPDLERNIAEREGAARSLRRPGSYVCSCCRFVGKFADGPDGRPNVACPGCRAIERDRFLQLMGSFVRKVWVPQTRPPERATLIEVVPSHATLGFRHLFGISKSVASLTDLPMSSDDADVLLALHANEPIPEDRKAVAEIARVLAPTGLAILRASMPGSDMAGAGHDGNDFLARLNEAGLTGVAVSPRDSMLPESIDKYGLLPDQALVFAVRSDNARAKACLDGFVSSLRRGNSISRPRQA